MFDFILQSIYNYCLTNNIQAQDNKGKICISLYNCFESYAQPSFFTGENQIYCSQCGTQTNAIYSNNIYSLSPTIIISLNRGKDNKFKCKVDFPPILDLKKYVLCLKSNTYFQLKGVITHLGESGMEDILLLIVNIE